jgi:hypothetical protein
VPSNLPKYELKISIFILAKKAAGADICCSFSGRIENTKKSFQN